MKHRFILGVVAGVSSLALVAPLFVQAASSSPAEISARPVPSQACLQAVTAAEEAHLSFMDAMFHARKSALQEHKNALAAAAAIADDAERKDAVQKANVALRTAMQDAHADLPEALQDARDSIRDACDGAGFGMGLMGDRAGPMKGFGGRGPVGEQLAERLGMTAEELKAAIESGKTIQGIAQEHGITLPDMLRGQGKGIRMRNMWRNGSADSSSSSQ